MYKSEVEGKGSIYAKVVADSVANNIRLTTLELQYPRFIHSEFMTHRLFCLDGDSLLEFDLPSGTRGGKYKRIFTMTLREFVDKWFNGDSLGRSMRHRLSNMRIRQLNEDTQKIETCTVKDCFISGQKEVFEISAGGMKVAGSKDHRILTVEGWKTIEELIIGKDYIITRAFGKLNEDAEDPIRLKKFGDKWKSTWLNQIRNNKLQDQNYSCFDCGTELLTVDHELHHVIPIYEDEKLAFEYDNIVALCKYCHKERHKIQGWQGGTYLFGRPEKLEAIVSLGIKDTYDLEMNSEYENFVANGIIVHNSRNASSSRAIPVSKSILNTKAMPIHWGRNQAGMQAKDDEVPVEDARPAWNQGKLWAQSTADYLHKLGLHKQIVNRVLEPYQFIKVVVTATEWDNFFELRLHPDAQPEIQELASVMKEAMAISKPKKLKVGEYHLPYITRNDKVVHNLDTGMEELKKCSVARCARVSYMNHDNTDPDISKDIELHDRLLEAGHFSPFEHVASPMEYSFKGQHGHDASINYMKKTIGVTHMDRWESFWSGNFRGWVQYRHTL